VKNFIDFFQQDEEMSRLPWLVLGKGPSFSRHRDFDLTGYKTLSLNHAVRELAVDVAHIIDIEVVDHLGSELEKNAEYVVMPWFPHHQFRAGAKTLLQVISEYPVLEKLEREERLLWYDLVTGQARHGDHASVLVSNFGSEAAIALLAQAGATTINTLGVDGGTAYDKAFADIQGQTKLANGQLSFDSQFRQFSSIISKRKVNLAPLGVECPIPVFIGATDREWLPAKVLEYSIAKHSSITTKCHFLYQSSIAIPQPKRSDCQSRTSFSFQRFLIPELKGFSGKAIYLDSDMLVTDDISLLWQLDRHMNGQFDKCDLLCVKSTTDYQRQSQFSVMLLNCNRLGWRIGDLIRLLDDGAYSYSDLMHDMKAAPNFEALIPPHWNSLDLYEPGITSLVHFTDLTQQPWTSNHNADEEIWIGYLKEAINDNFITVRQLQEQINNGSVRPSLLKQLIALAEGQPMPISQRLAIDQDFLPPYSLKVDKNRTLERLGSKLRTLFKGPHK
jgi:hypothetical protein